MADIEENPENHFWFFPRRIIPRIGMLKPFVIVVVSVLLFRLLPNNCDSTGQLSVFKKRGRESVVNISTVPILRTFRRLEPGFLIRVNPWNLCDNGRIPKSHVGDILLLLPTNTKKECTLAQKLRIANKYGYSSLIIQDGENGRSEIYEYARMYAFESLKYVAYVSFDDGNLLQKYTYPETVRFYATVKFDSNSGSGFTESFSLFRSYLVNLVKYLNLVCVIATFGFLYLKDWYDRYRQEEARIATEEARTARLRLEDQNEIRHTVSGTMYVEYEELGRGAFNRVVCARVKVPLEDQINRRINMQQRPKFALKIQDLSTCDNEEIRENFWNRFLNEINIMHHLEREDCREHVAQIIRWDTTTPYQGLLLMEIGERTLMSSLNTDLTRNLIHNIWNQMCRAVDCIHRWNILHLDLKPSNFVWFGTSLKLIDFGISRSLEDIENLTGAGPMEIYQLCGTPGFMSPEVQYLDLWRSLGLGISQLHQILSLDNNEVLIARQSSDIWSLGAILYFIKYGNGRHPHPLEVVQENDTVEQQIAKITAPVPFPPSTINENFWEESELNEDMRMCLESVPTNRTNLNNLLDRQFVRRIIGQNQRRNPGLQ